VNIIGEDREETILDGENKSRLISCLEKNSILVKEVQAINGNTYYGCGIMLEESDVSLSDMYITNNQSSFYQKDGAGLYCKKFDCRTH